MNSSPQHRGVACYCAELRLCSAARQHLEFEGRGAEGGYTLMCFFFWADGARGNTDVPAWERRGGFDRNIRKKERRPKPTCVGMWKEKVHVEHSGSSCSV